MNFWYYNVKENTISSKENNNNVNTINNTNDTNNENNNGNYYIIL